MKSIKQRMNKEDEEGFTLIELMVVVLILGILMAIAIPTFLSLTSSAKTNAAESDLTTAAQDEAVYFTANGSYDGISSTVASIPGDNVTGNTTVPGVSVADPGINWSTAALTTAGAGTKLVSVSAVSTTEIVLGTAASNGSFYFIDDSSGKLTYFKQSSATPPTAPSTNTSWKAVG